MLTLTALDRCDRCGAAARNRATKAGQPSDLLFCNHHLRDHRDSLIEGCWLVESDESPAEPVPVKAYTE